MNIYISFFSPPKKYSPAQPRCGEGGERGGELFEKLAKGEKAFVVARARFIRLWNPTIHASNQPKRNIGLANARDTDGLFNLLI